MKHIEDNTTSAGTNWGSFYSWGQSYGDPPTKQEACDQLRKYADSLADFRRFCFAFDLGMVAYAHREPPARKDIIGTVTGILLATYLAERGLKHVIARRCDDSTVREPDVVRKGSDVPQPDTAEEDPSKALPPPATPAPTGATVLPFPKDRTRPPSSDFSMTLFRPWPLSSGIPTVRGDAIERDWLPECVAVAAAIGGVAISSFSFFSNFGTWPWYVAWEL